MSNLIDINSGPAATIIAFDFEAARNVKPPFYDQSADMAALEDELSQEFADIPAAPSTPLTEKLVALMEKPDCTDEKINTAISEAIKAEIDAGEPSFYREPAFSVIAGGGENAVSSHDLRLL